MATLLVIKSPSKTFKRKPNLTKASILEQMATAVLALQVAGRMADIPSRFRIKLRT